MDHDQLFLPADSSDFREIVTLFLRDGAAQMRSVEPDEYVRRCRRLWKSAKPTKLYRRRILIDELVSGRGTDLYCATFAELHVETDATGAHWKEPKDYLVRRKPLDSRRREFIYVYPTGGLTPEPDEPELSIQLLALFDVLGFETKLTQLGIEEMYSKYQQLIHNTFVPSVGEDKLSLARGMFGGEMRTGYLKLPIRYAYFSDTLLMWTPFHNAFVGTFLDRCSAVFCNAILAGLPLRGAVSVGPLVLHKKSSTFLGEPLVEAARLEAAQDAIGVALGKSVRSISFPPDRIMKYDPPVKPGKEMYLSGLVLDWARFWRDFRDGSAIEQLLALRSRNFEKYYDNAIAFARYSDENRDWITVQLEGVIGPFTKVDP